MPISGLNRAMVGSAAILGFAVGCFDTNQEQSGCEAWELALEARESAERAMAVLEYEAEQLEDWISADSTVEAWAEVAWDLVPTADSATALAWDEAHAALEAVDSTAVASLAAAESVASRYPDGLSTTALEAVVEAANAAAAAFEAVGRGCPRGPPRVAPLRVETVVDSVPSGCTVRAWAVAAEAESAVATEALWRAHRFSVLADSVLLDAQDTALLGAWEAGLDLPGSVFRAAIEAGVATRKAGDLVSELSRLRCPVG